MRVGSGKDRPRLREGQTSELGNFCSAAPPSFSRTVVTFKTGRSEFVKGILCRLGDVCVPRDQRLELLLRMIQGFCLLA